MGTWLPETCWATCKGEIKDNTKVTFSWFLIHTVVAHAGKCVPATSFLLSIHDTVYFLPPRTVLYLFESCERAWIHIWMFSAWVVHRSVDVTAKCNNRSRRANSDTFTRLVRAACSMERLTVAVTRVQHLPYFNFRHFTLTPNWNISYTFPAFPSEFQNIDE